MSNDDKLLVVSVMLPSLVKPSGGASAWSIINAADALCFTGGHGHLLSLSHIILISPHSIKTGRTHTERQLEMPGIKTQQQAGTRENIKETAHLMSE